MAKARSSTRSAEQEERPPLRLEWRDPADLAANDRNWRRHPQEQTAAIRDVIGEVGWAGALLFNEATGKLIDGHARKDLFAGKGKVPVLVGSWTEEQERKILATLDPLAAMAETGREALASLLAEVQTDSVAVGALLATLAVQVEEPAPPAEFPSYDESVPVEHTCPRCGYQWSGGEPS